MKELEVNKQLPVIKTNYEDVKASLTETMKKYKGIVVTEESLQGCKATQKELAGLRNKIDGFRKTVKKEMEVPIKSFESQCKELIGLIADTEQPIKDGINVFDNKRREEKKHQAEELIKTYILELELNEKYSKQLTVIDKYLNLSASKKSVKDDICSRAGALKLQQDAEIRELEQLKASIEVYVNAANADINTKLKADDFYKYIKYGHDITRISALIKEQHDKIKEAENPKPVEPPKEEKTVSTVKQEVSIPVDIKQKSPQPLKEEKFYFYELKVIANKENMLELNKLLKTPGFKYEVVNQGIVNK